MSEKMRTNLFRWRKSVENFLFLMDLFEQSSYFNKIAAINVNVSLTFFIFFRFKFTQTFGMQICSKKRLKVFSEHTFKN